MQFYWDVFGCPLVGVADTPPERVRSVFGVSAGDGDSAPACRIGWIRARGGGVLEIFAFEPKLPPERIPWNRVGLPHFCFDVRGIHRWHAYLREKGVDVLSAPERSPRGHWFFFSRDFDGNLIELIDLGYMYHVVKWLGPLGGWLFRRGMHRRYYEGAGGLGAGARSCRPSGLPVRFQPCPSEGMHYTLFDTAIGTCGVVWNDRGLTGVHLPDASRPRTRAGIARRFPGAVPGAPPAQVQQAIEGIVALLGGELRDLREIALDFDGIPAFNRRVYELVRTIPPGATQTYGEIAMRLAAPGTARAVGQALGRNPWPIVVPCHRVLAADGGIGGFSAPGGVATKRRMLGIEGVEGMGAPARLF